jgi:hypothetical protein
MNQGICRTCQTVVCSSCTTYGKCTTCSGINEYPDFGVCCDTTINQFRDFRTTSPSCSTCHSNCKTCHGPDFDHCLLCTASAIPNLLAGTCTCLSNQYMDNGECIDCPQGCLTCTSNIACGSCRPNFAIVLGICVCPTISYYLLNTVPAINTCSICN